ncbi:MAG: class I SAM-dependent methyltransferase [Verrucomicrobiota bacterium]|jgi:methionine biosynthesis protein MetW
MILTDKAAGPPPDRKQTQPDRAANGLLAQAPDPLRYDYVSKDPLEAGGLMLDLAPRSGRVLDVGCGTGALANLLRTDRKCEIVCVEPDEARARVARSRGLEVHVGCLETDLAPKLGKFDAIVLADVIEHLANPTDLILLTKAFLKPGGRLLISTPNVAHWSIRTKLLFGHFDYQPVGLMDATHLRWFTRRSLMQLLDACGFQVISIRGTACLGMHMYAHRLPWKALPYGIRRRVVQALVRGQPTLFTAQFIVEASPQEIG